MKPLDALVEAESETLDRIVEAYTSPTGRELPDDKFDNRPTSDNWSKKTSKPFNNQPTWDNSPASPAGGTGSSVRNGYRHREFDSRAGALDVAMPKLRQGSYYPDWRWNGAAAPSWR